MYEMETKTQTVQTLHYHGPIGKGIYPLTSNEIFQVRVLVGLHKFELLGSPVTPPHLGCGELASSNLANSTTR